MRYEFVLKVSEPLMVVNAASEAGGKLAMLVLMIESEPPTYFNAVRVNPVNAEYASSHHITQSFNRHGGKQDLPR